MFHLAFLRTRSFSTPFLTLLTGLLLLFSGCMATPLNNQVVQANVPIQFSGALPEGAEGQVPQVEVRITGAPFTSFNVMGFFEFNFPVSPSNPQTDGVGKKWYSWGGRAVIPFKAWLQVPDKNELTIQIVAALPLQQVTTGAFPVPNFLATFDANPTSSPQCDAAKATGNMMEIINACKSQTPYVTLTSRCGNYMEPCCKKANPCGGQYECSMIDYVPNPGAEGPAYFGDPSEPRDLDFDPTNPWLVETVPEGRQLITMCLAKFGESGSFMKPMEWNY